MLYPLFVHMYLEMVYNNHESNASKFMQRFAPDQEEYYRDDLKKVSFIIKKEHMKGSDLMENFKWEAIFKFHFCISLLIIHLLYF